MFHNFTFFEIKNAWGLIRSDLGHNEEINFFFSIARCFEGGPAPPNFDIFGRRKNFDKCNISLTKRNREKCLVSKLTEWSTSYL